MGLEQDMTENLQNDLKGAFFHRISALKRHCRSLAETTMFRVKKAQVIIEKQLGLSVLLELTDTSTIKGLKSGLSDHSRR